MACHLSSPCASTTGGCPRCSGTRLGLHRRRLVFEWRQRCITSHRSHLRIFFTGKSNQSSRLRHPLSLGQKKMPQKTLQGDGSKMILQNKVASSPLRTTERYCLSIEKAGQCLRSHRLVQRPLLIATPMVVSEFAKVGLANACQWLCKINLGRGSKLLEKWNREDWMASKNHQDTFQLSQNFQNFGTKFCQKKCQSNFAENVWKTLVFLILFLKGPRQTTLGSCSH